MELAKGDLLKLEFTGTLAASGRVFETTSADIAKASEIYDEKHHYKPRLVFYQSNDMIKGIEKELPSMNLNEEKEISIGPEDAFGKHNPELMRTLPKKEFEKRGYEPIVGMTIDVNGALGVVRAVSGGRVVVDFNHPIAGMDVKYKIKVLQIIKGAQEKVVAIVDELGLKDCSCSAKSDVLEIELKSAENNEDFVRKKSILLGMLQSKMPEFKSIVVKETYTVKKEEPKK